MGLDKIEIKKSRRKSSDLIDVYTKEVIKAGDERRTSDGLADKKHCVAYEHSGQYLSKMGPRTVKDGVTGKYIDKRHSKFVVIGGTLSKLKIDYTIKLNEIFPIMSFHAESRIISYVVSKKVAEDIGFKEDLFSGQYYNPKKNSPATAPVAYKRFNNQVNGRFLSPAEKIRCGINSPTYNIMEGKKYTFGIELETSAGVVPFEVHKDLNMSCVFDGSIRDDDGNKNFGGEYVTGVLKGDAGLRHLYKIVSELSKRCSINKTCSVHVHIGNLDFNKELIVMLWKVNQMLEKELFEMMPLSRGSRDHCRKMQKVPLNFSNKKISYDVAIDNAYIKLFKIVSLGKVPSKNLNKSCNHPAGNKCGYNTATPRYWWINFVPAMFNLKGEENYTIEFRNHSASLNFTKIKNWILITMGIVYVAENHQRLLASKRTMTIKEVLKLAYPSKWKYLSDYVDSRKALFSSSGRSSLSERAEYAIDRETGSSNKTIIQTICA